MKNIYNAMIIATTVTLLGSGQALCESGDLSSDLSWAHAEEEAGPQRDFGHDADVAFSKNHSIVAGILEVSTARKWHMECDGISDRGISNLQFSSLSACLRAARRACVTRDGKFQQDAECVEASD
jgi:hypothetical protein